jgi:hypothetical protein
MSETRYRSKGVFVRFTPAQFEKLCDQAAVRGVTVPELLRDRSLVTDRAAS